MKNTVLLLFLFAGIFACKKEDDGISLGNKNNSLLSYSHDTSSVVSTVRISETTQTSNRAQVFLGSINATEIGIQNSSIYTSPSPKDLSFRIPDGGITVTDASLRIPVIGSYGSNSSTTFNIYELTEKVIADSSYSNADSLMAGSALLGSFTISSTDTATYETNIDIALAERILGEGNVAFTTEEVFTDIFKGFLIKPAADASTNEGCTWTIDADGINFSITGIGATDGNNYSFTCVPSSNARSFTRSQLSVSNSDATNEINAATGNEAFVSGLGGLQTTIDFPHLNSWYKSNNVIINSATITIPYTAAGNSNFSAITSLTFHTEENNTSTGVQAVYDNDSSHYQANIQSLINDQLLAGKEVQLVISALNDYDHPEFSKLKGASNTTTPIKLQVFYTKF